MVFFTLVLLGGGHIATTALHGELDCKVTLVSQRGDDLVGVMNGDRRISLDQVGGDFAWAFGHQAHGLGFIALDVHADNQALDVQDDVSDIFKNARHGREFVGHARDLDLGDCCTFET